MNNEFDTDIKIASEKFSQQQDNSAELYGEPTDYVKEKKNGNLLRAENLGKAVAEEFLSVCKKDELTISKDDSESLITQKVLLLSFTVMAGFEQYCANMALANTARTAFFNRLAELDADLFNRSSDTGAFSFYYLSFRRGTDVDRRIGQTFAMLCSHDGDPIYQELGEALYCWFSSIVQKNVNMAQFV